MAAAFESMDPSVDRECTCGQYYGLEEDIHGSSSGGGNRDGDDNDNDDNEDEAEQDNSSVTSSHTTVRTSTPRKKSSSKAAGLGASFVHLPTSQAVQHEKSRDEDGKESSSSVRGSKHSTPHKIQDVTFAKTSVFGNDTTFWHDYQFMSTLQKAVESPIDDPPELCLECTQRVEQALYADTDRLQKECMLYPLHNSVSSSSSTKTINETKRAQRAYLDEIAALEAACQEYQAEWNRLRSLHKQETLLANELDRLEEALEEERNALQLEARAFDNDQEQFYNVLCHVQAEVDRLISTAIEIPSAMLLVDLQVDQERGLRYPLLNELRLAYRPKGDMQWDEIQASWALAAHLLLVMATLLQFRSTHYRIVPLARCAKLIYFPSPQDGATKTKASSKTAKPIVYNLGHPKTNGTQALLAWNGLLHAVVQHAISQRQRVDQAIPPRADVDDLSSSSLHASAALHPPYATTATKMAQVDLTTLHPDDDAGWSRAIHGMASNLLWLSECTSYYVRKRVLYGF